MSSEYEVQVTEEFEVAVSEQAPLLPRTEHSAPDRTQARELFERLAALPADDPERVARYVQVQDASTPRQYFLRVPPTVTTADEAVAWTWGMSTEQYRPSRET